MDKRIILIGCVGVGKSTLRKALMQMLLCQPVVIVDNDSIPDKSLAVFLDDMPPLYEPNVMADDRLHRRNKSDRKRNRANRWR